MDFDFNRIITITLFAATFRMTTPILLATLGGIFSSQTGIFHVGLEGLLDIGAVSYTHLTLPTIYSV